MKINTGTSKTNYLSVLIAVVSVLLLSLFVIGSHEKIDQDEAIKPLLKNNISTPTTISLPAFIQDKEFLLYKDDSLSISLLNEKKHPRLIYTYHIKPTGKSLTDRFFVHIFVKDTTKLKGKTSFANVDFYRKPERVLTPEGTVKYIFQKELISDSYDDLFIPPSQIDSINTGRYNPETGRSLVIKGIQLNSISEANLRNGLDKLSIHVGRRDFEKIKLKRQEALNNGVLTSENKDLVKGAISYKNGEKKNCSFRLKGDWTDHLEDEKKWSYRIIMEDGATHRGMRKFSIQHPKSRNHLWEWLFSKVIKDQDMISLRYHFVNVDMLVSDNSGTEKISMGIMAQEESFDKILIENNKKREGIILALDESLLWEDRKKLHNMELDETALNQKLYSEYEAPIKVFNENKVLADSVLSKQFETARILLEGLRESKYRISEVFDIEKLSTFVALSNLFGAHHGLVWHNLRIYYNPITGKLEPIAFDSEGGIKLEELEHYPFSDGDEHYHKMVREKLALVSSDAFIQDIMNRHYLDLQEIRQELITEYYSPFNDEVLTYNSNFIKKSLSPTAQIIPSLLSYNERSMTIAVKNVSQHPVTISGLYDEDGRLLNTDISQTSIDTSSTTTLQFSLNAYFNNAFVSKKNKKGGFRYPKDVHKLRIAHYIEGIDILTNTAIRPYGVPTNLTNHVNDFKKLRAPNLDGFNFVTIKNDSVIAIQKGKHTLNRNLKIPPGYKVNIAAGTTIDLKNNASILSDSPLFCSGQLDSQITFTSSDGTGGGLFVNNTTESSQLLHCVFNNLSNPNNAYWHLSGSVNFHEADVVISNTTFKNNRCEDALNIIRSSFTLTDSVFENTQSDSFDGDFVEGRITRCVFLNSGNDGIDVSGSKLDLEAINVSNPSDKAISAGENSNIIAKNITIQGGEIGIVSKDLSTISAQDVSITDTRLGISAFQKKSEYGVAAINIDNLTIVNFEVEYLIEHNSTLIIDNKEVATVSDNVIDQMYGNEYGKSSR
ncbi:MAG: hypothetical protein K0U54_05700 [Bacteroidetes bacterium]|nr:hypothetical protein [Bacteroidota bacterium]